MKNLNKIFEEVLWESNLTELIKRARQYPGSYDIIENNSCKIGNNSIKFIRYRNPNNCTNFEYIEYKVRGGVEDSITVESHVSTIEALKSIIK